GECLGDQVGRAEEDPRGLAGISGGADDSRDRVAVLGRVELAEDPHREREVGRADEDDVDAGYGGDPLDLLDGAGRLDLRDAERGATSVLERVRVGAETGRAVIQR